MDINPTVFSSPGSIVKIEPDDNSINDHSRDRIEQLRKTYHENLKEFRDGGKRLNETSSILRQCEFELDEFQRFVTSQENRLLNKEIHDDYLTSSKDILQTKNIELITENRRLKNELCSLESKHQIVLNEMKHTRDFLSRIIDTFQ